MFSWGCQNTNIDNLDPTRYEEEIKEFDRENQYKGARTGSIVLLGGAKLRGWSTVEPDFKGMPVINRAFGEATFREILHYYRRLLDPFQAEVIVMNAGENDIVLGASAEEALKSFNDFVQQLIISNRASRIVYISMIPSPKRMKYWPDFHRANELIKAVAAANPRIEFLDVTQEYLGSDGQPIEQLFQSDGVNLNTAGYARLSNAVVPVTERMF